MRCVHCGEALKEGSLFCSKCGKEVQMVPDYNVYDEDYLKQVLKEENSPSDPTMQSTPANSLQDAAKKKKQTYLIIAVSAAVLVFIILMIAVAAGVKNKRAHSYEYQVRMADEAYSKGDIETAISYYENALALDKDNIEIRLILAQIYNDRKDYDSVMILCQEIIQMDHSNRDAFEMLIALYESQKNYDAILALHELADESLEDMFAAYMVTAPKFSQEPGTYESYLRIELTAYEDFSIYYSLDGSDPTLRGERYTMPIELNENKKTYTIRAVCMNDKGLYSEVIVGEYKIDIPAPDMPIVTPAGGDFGVETSVTITVPDGCSAYYTWDGSDPNIYSSKYIAPIKIPVGNNVLSVIIYDETTDQVSDVFRGNYIFYPEEDEGETIPGNDENIGMEE